MSFSLFIKVLRGKRCVNQVSLGIFLMALLLLLGSFFLDDSGGNYYSNSGFNSNSSNNYIFYLENINLGKQTKITESFPNVELGSKERNRVIYIDNNFQIKSNPFSKVVYSFDLPIDNPKEVNKLYFYFNLKKELGDNNLVLKINGKVFYKNKARPSEIPIVFDYRNLIYRFNQNVTRLRVTFEIEKPPFYSLFNWNRFEVKELRVLENSIDRSNIHRTVSFSLDKKFLENLQLNFLVDCKDTGDNVKPIRVLLNGYIVDEFLPDCHSRYNRHMKSIPLNILSENNTLLLETEGYYKLAYSINKIYFNDLFTYKFTINDFSNLYDVVMSGDFDRDVIDIRINRQTVSLVRNQVKSIIQYLRYGTNEITFLTKPLSIKEFIIENNNIYE